MSACLLQAEVMQKCKGLLEQRLLLTYKKGNCDPSFTLSLTGSPLGFSVFSSIDYSVGITWARIDNSGFTGLDFGSDSLNRSKNMKVCGCNRT